MVPPLKWLIFIPAAYSACNSEFDLNGTDCTVEHLSPDALLDLLDRRGFDGNGLDYIDLIHDAQLILDFEAGIYLYSQPSSKTHVVNFEMKDVEMDNKHSNVEDNLLYNSEVDADTSLTNTMSTENEAMGEGNWISIPVSTDHSESLEDELEVSSVDSLNKGAGIQSSEIVEGSSDESTVSIDDENQVLYSDSIDRKDDLFTNLHLSKDTKEDNALEIDQSTESSSDSHHSFVSNVLGYVIELSCEIRDQMGRDINKVLDVLPQEISCPLRAGAHTVSVTVSHISKPLVTHLKQSLNVMVESGRKTFNGLKKLMGKRAKNNGDE